MIAGRFPLKQQQQQAANGISPKESSFLVNFIHFSHNSIEKGMQREYIEKASKKYSSMLLIPAVAELLNKFALKIAVITIIYCPMIIRWSMLFLQIIMTWGKFALKGDIKTSDRRCKL